MINDHKTRREWKIQLTISINFISSKDSNEACTMHSKSHNIEIMMGSETGKSIKELFESLLQNYCKYLEETMRGRVFIRNSIDLLYYHLQKISLNWGGSDIDSPRWLKNKKATIYPEINDNNCFQYALTVALNHKKVKNNPERISNLKPFLDQYNWKGIHFPSHKEDWKNFELNNNSIGLNIYFFPYNAENIRLAYKSKHNFKCENQIIILMITDGRKWHYLAVKALSALFREITSK